MMEPMAVPIVVPIDSAEAVTPSADIAIAITSNIISSFFSFFTFLPPSEFYVITSIEA